MDGLKPKSVSKVSSLQIPDVSQRLQPQPPAASTSAAGSRLKLEQSAADAPLEPARNKLLTRLRVNGNKRGKAKILVDNPSTSSAGRKFRTIAKGLGMITRARATSMSREQQAFFSKYGININTAVVDAADGDLFKRPEGMSLWQYIRKRLVIDPTKDYFYYWLGIVTIAYVYNLFFVTFRAIFLLDIDKMRIEWMVLFIVLDACSDLIYVLDSFVRSRTGHLEQGLLVRDVKKITKEYLNSRVKFVDIASSIPIELVYYATWFGSTNPFLRLNRLLRINRPAKFISMTEMRVSRPNLFRVICVFFYILAIIHCNAALYYVLSYWIGFGSDGWVYGSKNEQAFPVNGTAHDGWIYSYVYSIYWYFLVPWPVTNFEMVFVCLNCICGVLIFGYIVGNVGTMITEMSAARTNFQATVDAVKKYLKLQRISDSLVSKIMKWFHYQWGTSNTSEDVVKILPTRLQTEIAMRVHFETLRKVRIFQDCEAGLLAEMVLKLKPHVFGPGEYVCRKGDVGREMYIVKRGRLQVVVDEDIGDGKGRVIRNLHEGAVFGELSLLNIPGNKQSNRRSASIRSVGFADLFSLSKHDLSEALKEYPETRRLLIQKGREILEKDNLIDDSVKIVTKTGEEMIEDLRQSISLLEMRISRLFAEHLSTEAKLQARINFLAMQLREHGEEFDFSEDRNVK